MLDAEPEIRQLKSMAAIYAKHRNFHKAEELYWAIVNLEERQSGSFSPTLAKSLYVLGELCCEQGKYAEARPLLKRAIHIWEQLQIAGLFDEHNSGLFFMDALNKLNESSDFAQDDCQDITSVA